MIDFVTRNRFERLGVFIYSHEENTAAYNLEDDVPTDVKEERAAEIMEVQQFISEEINRSKVGKTFKVLFDRQEGDYFVGRTEFDSPEVDNEVLVEKKFSDDIRVGDFSMIQITSSAEFDLFGVPSK
jgi:ribosomal protein S12 methylthiotransferase